MRSLSPPRESRRRRRKKNRADFSAGSSAGARIIEPASLMNAPVHPEQGAVFDLSARTKLRVTGADRLRYLNGQISNDLRKASETNAIYACVLSAKGKINADAFIHAEGDSFLLDADAELREQLIARLERYVIADDVVIEDVTERFALFHVLGTTACELGREVLANRYRDGGVDLWIET